jgi:hypothetical protein
MSSLDKLTDTEWAHCVASILEELEARKDVVTTSTKLIAFELALNKEADRMVTTEEKKELIAAAIKAATKPNVQVAGNYVAGCTNGNMTVNSSTKTTSVEEATKTHPGPAISRRQLFPPLVPDLLNPKVHWSPELKEVKEKNVKRGQSYVPT